MERKQLFTLIDRAGTEKQFRVIKEFVLNRIVYMAAMPYPDCADNDEAMVSFFRLSIDKAGERLEYVRDICEVQEALECLQGALIGGGE